MIKNYTSIYLENDVIKLKMEIRWYTGLNQLSLVKPMTPDQLVDIFLHLNQTTSTKSMACGKKISFLNIVEFFADPIVGSSNIILIDKSCDTTVYTVHRESCFYLLFFCLSCICCVGLVLLAGLTWILSWYKNQCCFFHRSFFRSF